MINKYLKLLYIFSWSDFIEICFFAVIIHYFCVWLKQDKQKKLLPIFYGMCSLFILSNFFQLQVMSNFLIAFWPALIMIFILVHQNILQKNFITLKNITPSKSNNTEWLDIFIRSCLVAMNNNKQITAVIEGADSLSQFLVTSLPINSCINKELLDVLINSSSFDEEKMIWINNQGKIHAINASWNIKDSNFMLSDQNQNIEEWKHDAALFTLKNDSLVFRIHPTNHTFDIIIQGKLLNNIYSNNAIKLIQQFVRKKDYNTNEVNFKKNSFNQPIA